MQHLLGISYHTIQYIRTFKYKVYIYCNCMASYWQIWYYYYSSSFSQCMQTVLSFLSNFLLICVFLCSSSTLFVNANWFYLVISSFYVENTIWSVEFFEQMIMVCVQFEQSILKDLNFYAFSCFPLTHTHTQNIDEFVVFLRFNDSYTKYLYSYYTYLIFKASKQMLFIF